MSQRIGMTLGSKSKYTANQVIKDLYMDWLNYPNAAARVAMGLPATKGCFAKKNHISRSQLWRYEKDFDFQRERMETMQNLVSPDDWKAIVLAQKANAINGNLNAAKWLDEKLGLTAKDPSLVDDDSDDFDKQMAGMTEEQLEAFLAGEDDS